MNKIITIIKKELAEYFRSPVAYIVLIISISLFNIFFFMIIDRNMEASLRDIFKVMEFMFVFLVPILTMRVFSEEKLTGTMEFLMTTPTSNTAIVLGKYFGSLIFFSLIVAMALVYYFIIESFASPDALAILSGYAGVWLEGALFIAVGVMASSWTSNQIVAAMSSYIILFLLYFSESFIKYFDGAAAELIRHASTLNHAGNFFEGIITISGLAYYLSGIFICIILTRISIENRICR